jgi:quercetin dioxygenase-like cupin family protein
MIKKFIGIVEEHDFTPVRKSVTSGVLGRSLIPDGVSNVKVTLTRVSPKGKFSLHRDDYHHVIYVIKGEGEVNLEDESCSIGPGAVVEIPAGVTHGYQNTAHEILEMIVMNIPTS